MATLTNNAGYYFLNFFNLTNVYDVAGFKSERQARKYAAQSNITIYDKLPLGVKEYEHYS